jgi:hypothetical protein
MLQVSLLKVYEKLGRDLVSSKKVRETFEL